MRLVKILDSQNFRHVHNVIWKGLGLSTIQLQTIFRHPLQTPTLEPTAPRHQILYLHIAAQRNYND
ncbi:hypothetical protein DRO03_05935 [Methanosarcinales archaeon]|nr:MAG: hypothetical protein DRO03_05935 [Methanosarcinales archaeon]